MRIITRSLFAAALICGLALAQTVSVTDEPVRVSGSEQQSKLIKMVKPTYPADAKAAGVEGTVRLEVQIGKDGTVKDAQVQGGPEELTAASLEAVKKWQWEPTILDGKPVGVITHVDVNYSLAKQKEKNKK